MDNPVFLNNKHSVYIGIENEFYRLFEVDDRNIRKCLGIAALGSMCQPRLNNLYQKIIKYVEPNIYDI